MPPYGHLWFGLWTGQFHVSACSQQALCYYAKNTDEQLENVKDIHKSDCPHCQWFDKSLLSEIVIWLIKKNVLLSLSLTTYSLSVFFPATGTKAGAIEGCQTWMSLTLSDTECPA